MALGNYRQAARTAVLIARQELELGNYKVIVGPYESITVCDLAKASPHHGDLNLYHVRFITLALQILVCHVLLTCLDYRVRFSNSEMQF